MAGVPLAILVGLAAVLAAFAGLAASLLTAPPARKPGAASTVGVTWLIAVLVLGLTTGSAVAWIARAPAGGVRGQAPVPSGSPVQSQQVGPLGTPGQSFASGTSTSSVPTPDDSLAHAIRSLNEELGRLERGLRAHTVAPRVETVSASSGWSTFLIAVLAGMVAWLLRKADSGFTRTLKRWALFFTVVSAFFTCAINAVGCAGKVVDVVASYRKLPPSRPSDAQPANDARVLVIGCCQCEAAAPGPTSSCSPTPTRSPAVTADADAHAVKPPPSAPADADAVTPSPSAPADPVTPTVHVTASPPSPYEGWALFAGPFADGRCRGSGDPGRWRRGARPEADLEELLEQLGVQLSSCGSPDRPVLVDLVGFASSAPFAAPEFCGLHYDSPAANRRIADARAAAVKQILERQCGSCSNLHVAVHAADDALPPPFRKVDVVDGRYDAILGGANRGVEIRIRTPGACRIPLQSGTGLVPLRDSN